MKLSDFLKNYYGSEDEITTKSKYLDRVFNELILPGSYKSLVDFRKTISWNLERDVFYRKVSKDINSEDIYVTLTTGKMEFYLILDTEKEFLEFLNNGLKKHRSYRKENLTYDPDQQFLYYSRKYE